MGGPKLPEQERCDAILAAAYQIALTEGLDAVTARRVATAAGISPGLVFFHFQSKDGLLQALLDVLLNGTLDALTDPALAGLEPWDRLERMIRVELERLAEHHAGVELLFGFYFARRDGTFRDSIEASFGRYLDAFLPVCREVAGAGDRVGAGDDVGAGEDVGRSEGVGPGVDVSPSEGVGPGVDVSPSEGAGPGKGRGPGAGKGAGPGKGAGDGLGGTSGDDLAATVVALIQGASIQAIRNPASVNPEALLATIRALRPPAA